MVGSYYPITGIVAGRGLNGKVPVRMEIDDWWFSRKPIHQSQHSLALVALKKMYEMSPHDKLSYYQIAGIHNQPIVPWDNTPFENKNYCMHSTPNFPTWHRPYVALLEQRMYETMVNEIIPTFHESDREDLKKAADDWRFPFWDFATKKKQEDNKVDDYDIPKCVRPETVEVRTPDGSETIPNPFHQFWMANGLAMGDKSLDPDLVTREPYTRSKGTSRHPYVDGSKEDSAYLNDQDAKGIVNNQSVEDEMQTWKWEAGGTLTGSLRDWFYRVLLITPYPAFATKKANISDAGGTTMMSACEDIHDTLHDWGGGQFGHMGAPAVGAFDPIFWMHHCNVDRMLELWAGLHPAESREWLEKDADATVDLVPFRANQYGDYLNSRDIWTCESLGYTYPETKRWLPEHQTNGQFDEAKLQKELTKKLEKKYNSAAAAARKAHVTKVRQPATNKSITHPDVGVADAPTIDQQIAGGEVKGAAISVLEKGKSIMDQVPDLLTTRDYVANVTYEKYALDGHAFSILFFIGPLPEDGSAKDIKQAQTQIGETYAFVDPVEFEKGGCANCAQQQRDRTLNSSQIPLTNSLMTRYKQQIPHEAGKGEVHVLKSMDPEDVVPFLKQNFHWRVLDKEGKLIDKTRIKSLKVSVAMGTGEHFKDEGKLSNFKDYKILYDITANSESGTGAKPEDNLFSEAALTVKEGLTINNPVKNAEDAAGGAAKEAEGAASKASKGIQGALGLGK